ncbi:MAG TPA: beta-N-acetylhexosaminidase [Acidobacteriaceae bacterium]
MKSLSRLSSLALVAACFLLSASLLRAQPVHQRLLPAPAQIEYRDGSLNLSELCLARVTPSTKEDDFAVQTLTEGLHSGLRACGHGKNLPIRLQRTGDIGALPMPNETPGPNSREAYSIAISRDGVSIGGRSSAAVYYGVQTLLQMVECDAHGASRLPFATVHDWPALSYRGTLMDAGSEGPMLTLDEVKHQLDFIAKWKGNQYFFYSEGNIEMHGYPLLNPNARFTQQEVRDIVSYARDRHIDVVPAVEMYAHLHDLFRIEKYSDLADFPHGTQFNPNDPRVQAILQDWANQLNALFPSKFVDVGFDETWSLLRANEKGKADSMAVQLFIKQLTTVAGMFQAQGKTVMAYADIMVKIPGIVPRLPKGLIALPWWYEPFGDAQYKRWLEPLVAEHVPHIVTSGVTSWDSIAPDYSKSFENIDSLLVAGRKSHSLGLLNTLWTDDGQTLLQMSWPGIAYGAAAAWQQAPMQRQTFFADYSRIQYPPEIAADFSAALTSLDAAETSLQKAIGNETMNAFWKNPFRPSSLQALKPKREDLRQARLHAEDALEHLYAIKAAAPGTPHIDTFIVGAQIIDLAGMKFIYAGEISDAFRTLPTHPTREQLMDVLGQDISNETHSRIMDMMDGLTETRRSYKAAWEQQYTPYRMGTALGRWDAEYEFWRRAQAKFEDLRTGFKTGDPLPTVQQLTSTAH